jgi:hypothetical protein
MPTLPASAHPTAGRRIRAGDADRERVAEQLGTHHADGRLDLDEFTARMDAAYAATYLDQLDPLLADLPAAARGPTGYTGVPVPWRRLPRVGGLPVPLLILGCIAVLLSIGAIANGMPPFPLFWLAVAILWWYRGRWLRASGHAGQKPAQH